MPAEANAVVGVRVSTSMGEFGPTGPQLFITLTGTPVRYRLGQG